MSNVEVYNEILNEVLACKDKSRCDDCEQNRHTCRIIKHVMAGDNPDSAELKYLFLDEPGILKAIIDRWEY